MNPEMKSILDDAADDGHDPRQVLEATAMNALAALVELNGAEPVARFVDGLAEQSAPSRGSSSRRRTGLTDMSKQSVQEFTAAERLERDRAIQTAAAEAVLELRRAGIPQTESLPTICLLIVHYYRTYLGKPAALQLIHQMERQVHGERAPLDTLPYAIEPASAEPPRRPRGRPRVKVPSEPTLTSDASSGA